VNIGQFIKWRQGYKYAPETVEVFFNGKKIDLSGTMIQTLLSCGQEEKAEQEIKRIIRKGFKKHDYFVYYFLSTDGRFSFTIPNPFMLMRPGMSLKERYQRFKDLKKHFSALNWQYEYFTTAELDGNFNAVEKEKSVIQIDQRLHIKPAKIG
jgi:hypothetical protein